MCQMLFQVLVGCFLPRPDLRKVTKKPYRWRSPIRLLKGSRFHSLTIPKKVTFAALPGSWVFAQPISKNISQNWLFSAKDHGWKFQQKKLKPPDPVKLGWSLHLQKTGGIRDARRCIPVFMIWKTGCHPCHQHPEQSRKRHKPYKVSPWKI